MAFLEAHEEALTQALTRELTALPEAPTPAQFEGAISRVFGDTPGGHKMLWRLRQSGILGGVVTALGIAELGIEGSRLQAPSDREIMAMTDLAAGTGYALGNLGVEASPAVQTPACEGQGHLRELGCLAAQPKCHRGIGPARSV